MKKITLFLVAFACSGLSFGQAVKKVLVEDETGTWCGYCPRGRTVMEDIYNTYPNAIGIANHVGDSYEVPYSASIDTINTVDAYGYPGGMVDRKLFSGQTTVVIPTNLWKSKTANQLLSSTSVNITILSSYNSSTRQVNVTVGANFVGSASGDLRISCVLIEDSIVNTSDPQNNYMGNGCSSPDPTSPWYNYPCSISNYIQRDVARANLAPNWGTAGVIPTTVASGTSYSQSYVYTLPSTWAANKISIVGFVSKFNSSVHSRDILNANVIRLGNSTATAIEENNSLSSVEVKQNTPNPFSYLTALQFTLNTTDNVSIKVYNTFGQVVNNLVDTKLVPGEHTFYWAGDDNDGNTVAGGVYYYTLSTSSQQITKPMIFTGR